MSQSADVTNAPRTDIVPDLTLCAPGVEEIAMAERYCEEAYLASVAGSVVSAPPQIQSLQLASARAEVKAGDFTFGMPDFDSWANRATVAPLLTLLCARRHHPKLSYRDACKLYDDAKASGDDKKYRRGTLELWGYSFDEKKSAGGSQPAATTTSRSQSPGDGSSPASVVPPPSDSGSAPATSPA